MIFFLSGCGSGGKKVEESKSLSTSTIELKGKHAKLFDVEGETYNVTLAEVNGEWQVRVKFTVSNLVSFDEVKDNEKYLPELGYISIKLVTSSDAELESLSTDTDAWKILIEEEVGEEAVVSGHTWSSRSESYKEAKAIFDRTAGIVVSGIELKEAPKPTERAEKPVAEEKTERAQKASDDDDDDAILDKETKKAIKDTKELLEAEGELLKTITDLF